MKKKELNLFYPGKMSLHTTPLHLNFNRRKKTENMHIFMVIVIAHVRALFQTPTKKMSCPFTQFFTKPQIPGQLFWQYNFHNVGPPVS